MSGRVRTLLLDANGWGGWKAIASETMLRGVLGISRLEQLPAPLRNTGFARHLLRNRYLRLSYAMDWRDAFMADAGIEVELCNIVNLVEYARCRSKLRDYPLIIVLHSATGDSMGMLRRTASWFQGRRGKLVVFVGNEYNLLDDKIGFIRDTGAEYVASQLPLQSAEWLYAECAGTTVVPMPHALNPALYHPRPEVPRTVDIGFVGADYPFFIGDRDRAAVLEFFQRDGPERGLTTDIRTVNMPRERWAEFLSGCRGVIGAEAGTRYLDRSGTLIPAVERYLRAHSRATFEDVFDRFFRDRPVVMSGKAISSRHFEPIGTLTCQLLLEGEYNDILRADEHYIALRRDLSNIDDALARFRDADYRAGMTQRTREYALAEHTYARRVRQLLHAVGLDVRDRRVRRFQPAGHRGSAHPHGRRPLPPRPR